MNQLAELLLNLIKEEDLKTRKENWDNLFLIVDFSRMKDQFPNMWNKEYKMLPLPNTWKEIKEKFTGYCKTVNQAVEQLIDSYAPYFESEIKPVLRKPGGHDNDSKTLLFRCKRLLENKVIGESSSLFLDLVIWEVEYRQVERFKEMLINLNGNPMFLTDREDELFADDCEKMIEGRINYGLVQRFYFKWTPLIAKSGQLKEEWEELGNYLRKWQAGKGASSEWAEDLKSMGETRDRVFDLGSESISDGMPFLQLGYIKEDSELGLKVVLQNRKGFNLNNPYCFVVWFHQRNYRLYVVKGYTMTDPKRLYVTLRLEEDWVWRDYGWVMSSRGSIDTSNHPIYWGRNLEENNKLPHLHYPFCSDLGEKAILKIDWPEKINFALFTIKQRVNFSGSGRTIPNTDVFIPGFYEVKKITQNSWANPFEDKEIQTFIAPSDYSSEELFYVREKQLFIPIPEVIYKHPHLPTHSTFQFYFLNNSLFTANLPYLDVVEQNGSKQVKVDWKVKTAPSGTYVFFQSGHIFFKWKIEVRQGIVNMTLVKVAIDGVSKMMSGLKKAAGSFFGIDTSGADEAQKDIAKDLVGRSRTKELMKREKEQKKQELQTERMYKSALSHTGDNPVEPSVFYANTVSFPYNLFDYWLRANEEAFLARIYYSNNLLNNIVHNNNINPITYPLNITFEKLAYILKPGYWKGELVPDHDPNNKMAECFARGVTFYKDKKEHFANPNLGVKQAINQYGYIGTGGDNYTAQAITEGGEGISVDIPYTADQRGYSHTTFIKLTDTTETHDFKDALIQAIPDLYTFNHFDRHNGFCWGCTYDDLKRTSFVSTKYTPKVDCTVILKLDKDSSGERDLDLTAGTEYTVTISETQFIFKSEGKTKLTWQKQPTQDDFSGLDWTPPAGSGGEIEIPLENPEIAIPEPGEGDAFPEDDFTPDTLDISGGEVEIPAIEIDLPPDITQDLDNDQTQDIDPPPVEIDVPPDQDTSQDRDNDQDQDRGDNDVPPPDPFDPDDDAD
jgi:hypothetical protein